MTSTKTKPHSVRTTESLWLAATRRAAIDGVKLAHVVSELLEGYSRGQVRIPPVSIGALASTEPRTPKHSIRCSDEVWNAADTEAGLEARTMNAVVEGILDGYARGILNLPTVVVKKSYGRQRAS